MTTTQSTRRTTSPWLISPAGDMSLLVALPLVILAILWILSLGASLVEVTVVAYGVFSISHHMPGFLKAYGDRELFRRHRGVLLFGPPLVFGLAMASIFADVRAILTFMSVWSLWHAFMQAYGILRLYGRRAGETSPAGPWMDRILMALLYGTCFLFWHEDNSYVVIKSLYLSGMPWIPRDAFAIVKVAMEGAFWAFLAVYLGYHIWLRRAGRAVSTVKIAYVLGVILFLLALFSLGLVGRVVAILAIEMHHDIQYYAIGYVAGKQAAASGRSANRLLAFMFGGARPRIGLYVMVLALYGCLDRVKDVLSYEAHPLLFNLFGAFVATSSLMHYYVDGFIWRRDHAAPAPSKALSLWRRLRDGSALPGPKVWQPVLAAGMVVGFLAMELSKPRSDEVRMIYRLSQMLPRSERAKTDLGDALAKRGDLRSAEVVFGEALAINPDSVRARVGLGRLGGPRAASRVDTH